MLNLKTWTTASGCWMAITFTLCVLGGVVLPSLPIPHRTLELMLPGFRWISFGSFLLGLAETFLFGVYAAWLFVSLHNFLSRRWSKPHAAATKKVA